MNLNALLCRVEAAIKTLDIQNFSLSIPTDKALKGILTKINITLYKGKVTALIGRSGSGKSQLAQSIINLNTHFIKDGEININVNNRFENILLYTNEELIKLRRKQVSYLFQDALQTLNPTIKCIDQLTEYLILVQSCNQDNAMLEAENLLQQVNLDNKLELTDKYPHQLSGGQLQRFCIAMAFASNAEIVIADEITSALDKNNTEIIYELLKRQCAQKNKSLLLITHDIQGVKDIADEVYVISDGEIVESGKNNILFHPQTAETAKLIESNYKKNDIPFDEQPIMELKNVCIGYNHGWSMKKKNIIKNLCFFINKGEKLAIVGESGVGKSTLAKAICGLIEVDNGKIFWKNKDGKKNVQMIFQNPYSSCNPRMTIFEILKEPFEVNQLKYENHDIHNLLNKVDLESSVLYRYPDELSGGQLQRVCVARALITKPQLLIMDEALSSLDNVTKVEMLELMDKIAKENRMSILFISHNLGLASSFCHRIIKLKNEN